MLGGRKRGKEKEKSVVLARWQAGLMHSCKFSGYKDNAMWQRHVRCGIND